MKVVLMSSLAGFVLAAVCAAVGVAASGGRGGSVAAGIMVGGFSGLPFGAMLGATVYFGRHPDSP